MYTQAFQLHFVLSTTGNTMQEEEQTRVGNKASGNNSSLAKIKQKMKQHTFVHLFKHIIP